MAHFVGEPEASGLARDIRLTITSEQFDLGGYTEQRARDLIHTAFKTPLTAPAEMIRITLVVGGGKLVRSRYPEDLPKWLVAALREIGYTEDRSAAETFDSQGTFKQQHDTGQNLKYLIVYPRVACGMMKGSEKAESESVTLDQSSPEYIVVACELATFQDIVASKVLSYNQKKRLLKLLQQKSEEFKAIEAKLVSGIALTPREQTVYDSNSGSDQEKINYLQNATKEMVDNGKLTNREKVELVNSIEANVQTLNAEVEAAKAENKPKKLEKVESKRDASIARKAFVEKLEPIAPRLQYGDEIRKLYVRLFPLKALLEEKERSMSLTTADFKLLEEKPELEAQILEYQRRSKGWFEDEPDFEERCQFEENEAKKAYRAKKAAADAKKGGTKSAGGTVGKQSSSASAWSTVAKKPGSTGTVSKTTKTSKSGFAAAFDSDSD